MLGICRGCLQKRHEIRKMRYEAKLKSTLFLEDGAALDSTPHIYMTIHVSYIGSPLSRLR